ncbi:hypothetical protein Tco_1576653 [Tanacetum coccineum]
MVGPIKGGGPENTDDRERTPPPLTKEQIEGDTEMQRLQHCQKEKSGSDSPIDTPLEESMLSKSATELPKIPIRRLNESLTTFKERWTVETGFIMGVPKVMKISYFMDSVKSPELAKRFSDKVPTTVNEMMEMLDDFVRSEAAYANTELPKGETG